MTSSGHTTPRRDQGRRPDGRRRRGHHGRRPGGNRPDLAARGGGPPRPRLPRRPGGYRHGPARGAGQPAPGGHRPARRRRVPPAPARADHRRGHPPGRLDRPARRGHPAAAPARTLSLYALPWSRCAGLSPEESHGRGERTRVPRLAAALRRAHRGGRGRLPHRPGRDLRAARAERGGQDHDDLDDRRAARARRRRGDRGRGADDDPLRSGPRARIGYVPQDLALYPDLVGPARTSCSSPGSTACRPRGRRAGCAEVLDADRAGRPGRRARRAVLRRHEAAAATSASGLLHQPKLLVLDEPTVGVDPQSRNAILESVERLSGAAWPCSTPPTTWRRPSGCATASASSTTAS